ncbi:UNVERIFIED_CONTAM: hypothetical protein K2H54_063604 [Gekko kuhli]
MRLIDIIRNGRILPKIEMEKKESTAETYLLTEEARRDSRWDPVGQPLGRALQGEATADTSSVWMEPRQGEGPQTPPEEQVIMDEDEKGEEEDPWTARLANLERDQYNIQRNLEEAILTIPEIVVRTPNAERAVERQGRELQRPPPPPPGQVPVGPPRSRGLRDGGPREPPPQ